MKPILLLQSLLLFQSFLLLSSHLFGQETCVLYQYETSSGFVWETFGDDKIQPKYEGEITYGNQMVKEHTLLLMETGLKGNGKMENHGTSQYATKTEIS